MNEVKERRFSTSVSVKIILPWKSVVILAVTLSKRKIMGKSSQGNKYADNEGRVTTESKWRIQNEKFEGNNDKDHLFHFYFFRVAPIKVMFFIFFQSRKITIVSNVYSSVNWIASYTKEKKPTKSLPGYSWWWLNDFVYEGK